MPTTSSRLDRPTGARPQPHVLGGKCVYVLRRSKPTFRKPVVVNRTLDRQVSGNVAVTCSDWQRRVNERLSDPAGRRRRLGFVARAVDRAGEIAARSNAKVIVATAYIPSSGDPRYADSLKDESYKLVGTAPIHAILREGTGPRSRSSAHLSTRWLISPKKSMRTCWWSATSDEHHRGPAIGNRCRRGASAGSTPRKDHRGFGGSHRKPSVAVANSLPKVSSP